MIELIVYARLKWLVVSIIEFEDGSKIPGEY